MLRSIYGLAATVLIVGTPVARPGEETIGIGESAPQAQVGGFSQSGFEAYLPRLRAEAERAGIRAATLAHVFPTLVFSARTIELDRAQPGGRPGSDPNPPFAPYRARQLTRSLIDRGRAHYLEYRPRLAEIGRRYGVPPQYLIAIWGKETGYGTVMGNFDLLNSLASLAYEGRRRALFTTEFIATLRLLERGFPRAELKGSWAGAAGHPQFLPSVYLRLAVDGDGDGRADIWRSPLDGLASIANYLRNAGWRPGLTWGTAVHVPAGFDRAAVANRFRAPRCAAVFARHSRWLTAAEWRRLGVVNGLPDSTLASLIEPDGPGATAYLTTENYRVMLAYNCSNFYVLTVALLADLIARAN